MSEKIVIGGVYRHFKGPEKIYRVLNIALDCEDPQRKIVVYEQLYATKDLPIGTIWARPLEDFVGAKVTEGGLVKRFELVSKK
jgi:hypothetical protein